MDSIILKSCGVDLFKNKRVLMGVKPGKNLIFLKNGKMVILVENLETF